MILHRNLHKDSRMVTCSSKKLCDKNKHKKYVMNVKAGGQSLWEKKKYVAYVGTYTHGTSKGIQVYDVDVENGTLTERSEVEVSNASHLAVSKNGKYLYSIEDEGVAVFERDENGDLSRINSVDINGMRGCYLATDVDGRYLYVAGYHDGKVTVVHIT